MQKNAGIALNEKAWMFMHGVHNKPVRCAALTFALSG